MAMWGVKLSFQNMLNYNSSMLEGLHDLVMVWLTVILLVVVVVTYGVLAGPMSKLVLDSSFLEQVWTTLPMMVLFSIAWPSIYLLCKQDSFKDFSLTDFKITSNQWNWMSESMEEESDHLLDVEDIAFLESFETPVTMPSSTTCRIVLTSTDVLHSLGMPSLGLKLDSIPGRLNSTVLSMTSIGVSNGSCYELCGSGHSAMPISFFVT
uniref:Cytochrome c oxidase subunit 2 n=1 Tax=Paralongidorus litoralis TaxID=474435 RepID=A0A1P8C767_9BILA|nr:cytochrome c oxidase subunit II [Paralongidorus litoralis]AOT84248.1 cytochrome c oxidase subunit II [Paralongidorus litoralis]